MAKQIYLVIEDWGYDGKEVISAHRTYAGADKRIKEMKEDACSTVGGEFYIDDSFELED